MALQESKSILAKLIASENINVIHAKIPTAAFDPQGRTLYLPIWNDMSGDLYDLLVCYEASHALHTPKEGWHTATEDATPAFKSYLNVQRPQKG